MRKRAWSFGDHSGVPYLYLLPAALPLLFFYLYPIAQTVHMAFTKYNILNPSSTKWVGFSNFQRVFRDPLMGKIILNTLTWVFVSLFFQFLLGFILALLLWKGFKGKTAYQSLAFLPWAIAGFITAIVFRWMFNAQFGVLSDILVRFGILAKNVSILSQPQTAMVGPIVGLVWQGIPFFAIMILAALQGVSVDVLEAADMDGCGAVRRLFSIILPFIKPTILVTLLLRVIWIFNSADIIYTMTNGGPMNASQTVATYMFDRAYTGQDFSFVSALSLLILLFLLTYTVMFIYLTKFNQAGE